MKKNRLSRVAFLLNGLLFLLGGIAFIEDGKWIFATIQLLASILNIAMVIQIRRNGKSEKFNAILLVMNIIVCLSFAVDSILADKTYIQYLWFVAALPALIALVVQNKRRGRLAEDASN